MASLLGLDCGLTVTKAVLFDADGTLLAAARMRVPRMMPRPRHVERDLDVLWQAVAAAIHEVLERSGRAPADVRAVAATGHGDGLHLLDRNGRPLGSGILSLDSRAGALVARWRAEGVAAEALALTGQEPHAASPAALLAWLRAEEPDRFARIGHVLSCKDWVCYRLTGEIGTDRTEASTAFADWRTQMWSRQALELYGLGDLEGALPPIAQPAELIGAVRREAAEETGLPAGIPVAAGLHDVTASALGIGGHREGIVAVVAGTYSINETVTTVPHVDPRWFLRSAVAPGTWHAMAISPASSANYDWFLDRLCPRERQDWGPEIHDHLMPEIEAAFARQSPPIFHPFLFGSPYGPEASGAFLGLRGWHERGDLLRAVLEGIALTHRLHVDALRETFPVEACHLTGGVSRHPAMAQLFADMLGLPVVTTDTPEAAAWGAALCAGAASGLLPGWDSDPRDLSALSTVTEPDPDRRAEMEDRFALYKRAAEALAPVWRSLEGAEA
ncbi:FGGY-family carbohydrate kinase [Rubellimicrobium sp. CFH 75288]|uniref:FGGY-family carbohydrate kinase n=1 Tax=Rubellimicrobium sp. CFH 75288 TaxID=2697034 RepID=UPI0014129B49|nr:FGGY-family carbohydrate kinase [Rubellimicrobium sp. CFH 75288]NAZ36362.1 carbohydrate kinase [Rubellimicrobium sp. CFH 75288]